MILAALFALGLSFSVWRRNAYRMSAGWLELLRLAIITVALITLLQPEFVTTLTPQQPSTVVVLRDRSGSMQTRDQIRPIPNRPLVGMLPIFLEDKDWLGKINDNMRVVVEPFSFEDHQSDRGTDIDAALKQATSRYQDLKAIVLASDGDWNVGQSPSVTAQNASSQQNSRAHR